MAKNGQSGRKFSMFENVTLGSQALFWKFTVAQRDSMSQSN